MKKVKKINNISFNYGTQDKLDNITVKSGSISVATDTEKLYVNLDGKQINLSKKTKDIVFSKEITEQQKEKADVWFKIDDIKEQFNPILANNSWNDIKKAAKLGIAQDIWKIGDQISILLNGTVGSVNLDNFKFDCYIIGFNHNINSEGNNTIHFQFGRKPDIHNKDSILFDSFYESPNSNTNAFRMNSTETNIGGWEGSQIMRKLICPQFFEALPQDLKINIKPCKKYTNNSSSPSSNPICSFTEDNIWLISEYELFGDTYYSTDNEKNFQCQYEYYKNNKNFIKYPWNDGANPIYYWTRSPGIRDNTVFCLGSKFGSAALGAGHNSLGFAPCFMIG